jgi:hypothetical protein
LTEKRISKRYGITETGEAIQAGILILIIQL